MDPNLWGLKNPIKWELKTFLLKFTPLCYGILVITPSELSEVGSLSNRGRILQYKDFFCIISEGLFKIIEALKGGKMDWNGARMDWNGAKMDWNGPKWRLIYSRSGLGFAQVIVMCAIWYATSKGRVERANSNARVWGKVRPKQWCRIKQPETA